MAEFAASFRASLSEQEDRMAANFSEGQDRFGAEFGEAIPMETPGAVHYDVEQELTEEEQARARQNIGATSEDALSEHTDNTDIHTSEQEKDYWDNKYTKPAGGIPESDLSAGVQQSLEEGIDAYSGLGQHVQNTDVHFASGTEKTGLFNTVTENAHRIDDTSSALTTHTGNSTIHVTSADKTTWNGKYTKPAGGIPKSDLNSSVQQTLDDAATDHGTLSAHVGNTTVHFTGTEKSELTQTVQALGDGLSMHTGDSTIHVTASDKQKWNKRLLFTAASTSRWTQTGDLTIQADVTEDELIATLGTQTEAFGFAKARIQGTWEGLDYSLEIPFSVTLITIPGYGTGYTFRFLRHGSTTKGALTGGTTPATFTLPEALLKTETLPNAEDPVVKVTPQTFMTADEDRARANIKAASEVVLSAHTSDIDIHVTTAEKQNWSYKYSKPAGGIPSSDLADKYAGAAVAGGASKTTAAIPYAQVDPTSTSTVFTATVPEITEYKDGVCVLLKNGVVTSAANFTININGLGAKGAYNNMAASTRETTTFNVNYTVLFVYDSTRVAGGCWIYYRGYYSDANSIGYQLRTNSSTLPAADAFARYRLLFTAADGKKWVPATTSTSTNATAARTVNQRLIDPFGEIVYYGSTSAVAAGANVGATVLWQQYILTLGYSFNKTGAALVLSFPAPIYLKCAPQSDGSAIIDADVPYVQTLPDTEDGKIYILLGRAYSATSIELTMKHPVYYFKDGAIRLWTAATVPTKTSDLTNDSGFLTLETLPIWDGGVI